MSRPERNEYAEFYEGYVSLMTEDDIAAVLAEQPAAMRSALASINDDHGAYAYDDDKWSIKEVIGHIIDGERVFGYRLHRISRGDKTPLSGFEQEPYVELGRANDRPLEELFEEFELLRKANVLMLNRFSDDQWAFRGTASDAEVSVRALAYIMAGHARHHINILSERYLA